MKAKLVKEEMSPADYGFEAARKEEPESVKIVSLMVDLQNLIQDVFESGFDIEMDEEEQQILYSAMELARKLEIKYGDEDHGITSVYKK